MHEVGIFCSNCTASNYPFFLFRDFWSNTLSSNKSDFEINLSFCFDFQSFGIQFLNLTICDFSHLLSNCSLCWSSYCHVEANLLCPELQVQTCFYDLHHNSLSITNSWIIYVLFCQNWGRCLWVLRHQRLAGWIHCYICAVNVDRLVFTRSARYAYCDYNHDTF